MPIQHDGTTDVAIGNNSAALQLITNGTTISLPSSGNGTNTRLELDQSSTALSWKKKHLAEFIKTSSQTVPPNVDVNWTLQSFDIGDISLSGGSVINLPVDNYYLINVSVKYSNMSGASSILNIVNGTNVAIGNTFEVHPMNNATSNSSLPSLSTLYSTYGKSGGDLVIKLRSVSGSTGVIDRAQITIVSL